MKPTIKSFTDLHAWQESRSLVRDIYNTTKLFPPSEMYVLTNQLRRAAISVSSNIAEGFKRRSRADKFHFYTMAHASLTEVQCQLILAQDLSFIKADLFRKLITQTSQTEKLLAGLTKATSKS